jgi:hypothetical protein
VREREIGELPKWVLDTYSTCVIHNKELSWDINVRCSLLFLIFLVHVVLLIEIICELLQLCTNTCLPNSP